jgi:hypothetical protein
MAIALDQRHIVQNADDDVVNFDEQRHGPFDAWKADADFDALAGVGAAAALRAESAARDAAVTAHYRKLAANAVEPTTAPAVADSDALIKAAMSPSARRKATLRTFIQKSIAAGESAADLIAFAQKHDPETANSLREISIELGVLR